MGGDVRLFCIVLYRGRCFIIPSMNTIEIWKGNAFGVRVRTKRTDALDATLVIGLIGQTKKFKKTVPFVNGVAFISVSTTENTVEKGQFVYYVTARFADGDKQTYPKPTNVPNFIVSERIGDDEPV